MRSIIARWSFFALILASALIVASGWVASCSCVAEQPNLFDLHASLALLGAAFVVVQLCLRLAIRPAEFSRPPHLLDFLGRTIEVLVYLAFAAAAASGALGAIFGGHPPTFFGVALPLPTLEDRSLAELLGPFWESPLRTTGMADMSASAFFRRAHEATAFLFAAALVAHVGAALLTHVFRPRPLAETPHEPAAQSETAPEPARGLAKRLRILGWAQFWLQLALALVCGLLLQFATSGRAFSPGASTYSDAIYWSINGLLLLCLADALAFHYTRAATRLASSPASFDHERPMAFWFLHAGLLTGLAGELISFVGLSLSISLLIAKTVSQPPGIAITDPNKIIRALDVFVLLVNFGLLAAHFVGTAFAAWLVAGASHARLRYAAKAPRPSEEAA